MDKKSLDIIVEEFFDTGKLVLNEIVSVHDQMRREMRLGASLKREKNFKDSLDSYNIVLDIFDNHLTDKQKKKLIKGNFQRDIIEKQIEDLQRKIENLEANNDDTNDDIESGEKNANLDDLRQQYSIQKTKDYDTNQIQGDFKEVKFDLEELYKKEGNVKDKFKEYREKVASPPVGRNPMMYYYEIDLAKESQNLTNDFISNMRKELFHLNNAKNTLEILTQGLRLNRSDFLEGENITNRIESLERTLNLESYGGEEGLPLFKSGHIIFEEDKFWLELLKNSNRNVEVEEYEEQQPNGETNKYLVYIGDEITIDDWRKTFCSERNYERYKNIIDSNDISCDIFRGDPRYYEFRVGQKVKFKQNVKLNKTNGEKSYYQCAEKIADGYPNDTIKSRAFILKIIEVDLDEGKVNLSYDYGGGIEIPLFRNGEWGGCPQKGEIKNVDIFKLEPYEKTKRDTYLGAQKFRRNLFKELKTDAERLNLSDIEYDILSNQLMEFAGNLQRLGIEPGEIDLRTSKKKITVGGKYTSSITSVTHDLTPNVDIEGATVLSLYENFKNKIFKSATTEQVRIILPYLMEINKRFKDLNKITKSKIVDFVNELDFEKPDELDDTFRQIIKKIADQYEESFCCNNDEYFKDCGSKLGDRSLLLRRGDNFKTMTDLIDSSSGTTECAIILYNKIISNSDRRIDKYDIISNNEVILDNFIIPNEKKVEVKSYDTSDGGYTLSEFMSIYKDKENRKTYKNDNQLYYQRHNEIVEEVVKLLNENDRGIKDSFLGEDKLFGVFLKDYTFYHYKNMKLEWSTISEQKRFPDEKRITVRFTVDGEGHKWVTGNCNLNEPNTIEESITNFFDTGNFEF